MCAREHNKLKALHAVQYEPVETWLILTNLEEACENVELKHRNVVVAGEVNGGFEGHGLQARADGMHFMKALSEDFPWHYCPAREQTQS